MENLLFFHINPEGESLSIRNTRDCYFAFCFASINIDITIFAMRFNNSPTIRFVPVSHRVIYWTWNSFARENYPLTENPKGFFSFSSFLSFSLFFFFFPFFDRISHAKNGQENAEYISMWKKIGTISCEKNWKITISDLLFGSTFLLCRITALSMVEGKY